MKTGAISLVLLILLTGCSADSEIERGMALRSALLQGDACSFQASIKADYADKACQFLLECSFDGNGGMTFSVLEPESIAGITGRIDGGNGALTFEDTALHFGLLADDQLSPVAAPWILIKTLRSGYLTSACMDGEQLMLTIDDSFQEDALTLDIWLNSSDLPERAEILYDGKRILSVDAENFVIT